MKKEKPEWSDLLTETEAAALLKVRPNTMAKWRLRGFGPRFAYVGRKVRYTKNDLAAWVAANSHNSTSETVAKLHVA